MPTFKMLIYRWKNRFLCAPGELLRGCWGKAHFPAALRIVRNELVFTLYLLILLVCLLTFNAKVIAIALLPLLAFIALKTAKNRSFATACRALLTYLCFQRGCCAGWLVQSVTRCNARR
jgi:hypothetical protein